MYHLSRIVDRAARLFGDRLAVVDGATCLSYAELLSRAGRLATQLARLGLATGDRVAILDRNSFRYLEANYACAQAGFVLVPLNTRLSPHEIDHIVSATQAQALLVSESFLPQASEARLQVSHLVTWGEDDPVGGDNTYERLVCNGKPWDGPLQCNPDAIAQIFFTSGTTGEPKGVCLTSRNLVASALDAALVLGLDRNDAWLHAAPMFHLVDAFAVWAISLLGARHVAVRFEPASFARVVRDEGVTKTSLPPTLINMVVQSGARRADLASLQRVSFGGSPMPEAAQRRAMEVFQAPLLAAYGISEVSGIVCQQLPGDVVLSGSRYDPRRRAGVGQPVPNADIRIVDEARATLPVGGVGEIAVTGPRVMHGYWRNAEATAAVIEDGWYFTGDIGRIDPDGHLTILDRKKDMIISGGENVYSAEVENALALHPDVVEAAAFGVPSETWGEEVRAVVFLRDAAHATPADLVSHCRGLIGGYKVPKRIEISPIPLPKSGPGKIAKSQMRAPYWVGRGTKI